MLRRFKWYWGVFLVAAVCLGVLLAGCQGAATPPPETSTGTFSGGVTNSLTNKPVAGVAVTTDPAIAGVTITTDASGNFSATLPVGVYSVSFKKDNFNAATQSVSLVAGQTTTKTVSLVPTKPVAVNSGADQTVAPSGAATLKAVATPLNDSTVQSYEWVQTAGVPATLNNANADTVQVTLGNADDFKDKLLESLKIKDKFTVLAINPHALEAAEIATFKVTVTTSSGKYTDTVNVSAELPYVVNTGLGNVPQGEPVLLHGKQQAKYSWTLAVPDGSKAALDKATDQNPSFTPDVSGKYTATEKNSGATIEISAGTWAGAITGQDDKGRPVAAGCTACHNGTVAPNAQFTAWKDSGHAEIFTQNLNNPDGHWTMNCAGCHSVGYDPKVTNGGFDEAVQAEGWKAPPHGEIGLWTEILKDFPKTAQLANIQCENCHGPNNSPLHANKQLDASRISLSSDVCASCHGEPARHGRFQMWEDSRHAGTATTPARATSSASCARCHSAQGFLAWIKQPDMTKQLQGANGNATVAELAAMGITADNAEPVTCATCHDPHDVGTGSSLTRPTTTDAKVRIVDTTSMLPAGFQAKDVGKGALCMTCHNTRNAVHNIDAPPTSYSAPHTAAQADVLMGENAYFVAVPQRSPHSYVKDTCVTCHMEATPPPPEYTQTGTNHTFRASTAICATCHSNTFNAEALQVGVEDKIHDLGEAMAAYLLKKMPAQITVKDYTPHDLSGKSYDVLSDAIVLAKDNIASMEPTEPHGQQGFIIELKNAINVTYSPAGESPHTVSMKELEVRLGDFTTDGTKVLIATTDPLVKAGWNFFLIEGDGSWGVHNPQFANSVIDATIAALK